MKVFAIVTAVAVIAGASAAHANKKKADELFERGKRLLAKKKYAEACRVLEQVDELDPAIGAKLNVGKCFEDWGKLSRAHAWYVDAEKMAVETGDKRADKIKELIDELDPDVPRLTIRIPEGVDVEVAQISLDGEPVPVRWINSEQRVDPGPHVVTFRSGGKKKRKTIALERGSARDITLEIKVIRKKEKDPAPEPEPEPEPANPPPPDPGRARRMIGLGVAGAGVVGIGIASFLTLSARGDYNDALDAHCMGMPNACNDEGLEITHDARGKANIATVITLVGLAAAAGGVVLYLTAPEGEVAKEKRAVFVTPVIGDGGGGLVIGGGF